jgi:hypothetical protein
MDAKYRYRLQVLNLGVQGHKGKATLCHTVCRVQTIT